jgi:hypothetical protein
MLELVVEFDRVGNERLREQRAEWEHRTELGVGDDGWLRCGHVAIVQVKTGTMEA